MGGGGGFLKMFKKGKFVKIVFFPQIKKFFIFS